MPRVTLQQPAETFPNPSRRAISLHRLPHIVRTGRIKAARRGQQRGQSKLVHSQRSYQEPLQRRKRRSTSSCNSGNGACKALGRGLMTMDHCGLSRARERRTASRSRRLIRLRATALPRARETVKPIRGPLPSGSRTQKAAKNGHENRLPFSYTLRKSCGRSRRTRFGKPAMENYLSELTESFLRPRARRRDSTARPSCVFMRVRKPCVLARRRLLGWNVRFGILFQFTSIKQPKRTGKPRTNRSGRDKPGIVFPARALRGWKSNSPGLRGQNQGGEGGFAGGDSFAICRVPALPRSNRSQCG